MPRRPVSLLAAFLALAPFAGSAQSPVFPDQSRNAASQAPAFDVAAIHVYIPEPHEHSHIWIWPFDSHFKAQNVSLIALIHWAFDMPETRILDAPQWAGATHFSVDAKADSAFDEQLRNMTSEAARAQQKKMVQALLADRFRLVTHSETRQLPIYLLVVARDGPKPGAPAPGGAFINHGRDYIAINGYSNGAAPLAEELSKEVGRDVLDKTGITGRYDIRLTWTPDDRAAPASGAADSPLPVPDSGPSIFTALEEQLGLKLEPSKGPVQVLVVDHAELPSPN